MKNSYFSKIMLIIVVMISFIDVYYVNAQIKNYVPPQSVNINDKDSQGRGIFKFIACDGPAIPDAPPDPNYIPCDFKGLMRQVQHFINILLVGGVLAAIFGFSWAGYLYITGKPNNISKATSMFPKIAGGFILMLSAWFIVYQILSWLTDNPGFKSLLGNP